MRGNRDPVNTGADGLPTAHPTHPEGLLKWIVMIDSIWRKWKENDDAGFSLQFPQLA